MSRKPKHEEHENHERWLVSYADFITLLFAFFVVMYATNQTDPTKAKAVEEGIEDAFSKSLPQMMRDWLQMEDSKGFLDNHTFSVDVVSDPFAETTKRTLDGSLTDHTVQIGFVEQDLTLTPPTRHHFAPASAELHPSAFGYLARLATALDGVEAKVQVIGHADAAPLVGHSAWFDNWDLASARATAAVRYLVGQGMNPEMLEASAHVTLGVDPNARAFTIALRFDDASQASAASAALEAGQITEP